MKNWLIKKKSGLFCEPGNFYIDPIRPVDSALITHAHTDHARPNNKKILATKETINIMKIRYQDNYCKTKQQIKYGEKIVPIIADKVERETTFPTTESEYPISFR